jgi:hypothetical protein
MTGTKKRSTADSMGVEAAMVASPNNGIVDCTGLLAGYRAGYILLYC